MPMERILHYKKVCVFFMYLRFLKKCQAYNFWTVLCRYVDALTRTLLECKRNVMAHAQKPDSVFQRNGRVHLYWRGCQFSRVLAFLQCGSVENDCSNTGWTVRSQNEACLVTHSIRLFPLHFPSRASPCATRFRFHSTTLLLLCSQL